MPNWNKQNQSNSFRQSLNRLIEFESIFYLAVYFNRKLGREKVRVQNPAHIPPQTPLVGGKSAEAGRILSPRQIVSPCRVRISIFNHLDFTQNSFELCPTNTATTHENGREPFEWVVVSR